ncbi:unnamed protein product [Larinioides sclopetarius]|uniref:Flavin-containing monooxygenase n=1 Tax=Larinioides sclopetarius TaxID=280406 RepID=A0AAV1YVT0_9ARAC
MKDIFFLRHMESKNKRVAVLGGGLSGLGSWIALKEAGAFDVICFEKTDIYGGTWSYREHSDDGVPSIMPTTTTINSKELIALSNFPPPKECNNYMRYDEFFQYLKAHAERNDGLNYVRYNFEVVEVKRCDDYEITGKWAVTVRNTISGEVSTGVYDALIVSTGHINRPKMPSYPGQDLFKGKIIYSHSLKGVEPYRNKTILVVGMGCSGLDAAVETNNVAKKVYLSTRSGRHVINRIGLNGYPYDYILIRPYLYQLLDIFPASFVSWCFETGYLDNQFHHNLYSVVPDHHVFSKDPAISSQIGSKLITGAVIQKPDIETFAEDGVVFKGETEVTKADVVIMATGYTWKFPYLEEGIIIEDKGKFDLYKCVFPIHMKHSTIAFVGFFLPFGPGIPPGELQCRWVAQVFAGKCNLPSKKQMLKDAEKRYKANLSRYGPSEKVSIKVNYIQYCDELAAEFGAKPDILKFFFTDIRLFFKIMFGPSLAYQYRLQGPHPWDGAREAIMTSKDRMLYPLTKKCSIERQENVFKRIARKTLSCIIF